MDEALLDTDTLTEFFKGRNAQVDKNATAYLQAHGQFCFSAPAVQRRYPTHTLIAGDIGFGGRPG